MESYLKFENPVEHNGIEAKLVGPFANELEALIYRQEHWPSRTAQIIATMMLKSHK